MSDDHVVGSRHGRFASTQWSMVLQAGRASAPGSAQALESLCRTYWYPLYVFARRRGWRAADAEDLTQAFLARLLDRDFLRAADPKRGRFRTFLLTAFRRFLASEVERQQAQKRGGGISHLSLDFANGEERYELEPADPWTPQTLYQRRWALLLLDGAMKRLRDEYTKKEKAALFEHGQAHLTGTADGRYHDAATALGMTEGAFRVAMHRMRDRFRVLLHAEIAQTLDNPADIESELQELRAALRGEALPPGDSSLKDRPPGD